MKNRCVLILTHFHLVFCNLPLKYAIHHVDFTLKMYAFFLSKSILSYSACCWHAVFVRIISCNVKRKKEKKIKSALIISDELLMPRSSVDLLLRDDNFCSTKCMESFIFNIKFQDSKITCEGLGTVNIPVLSSVLSYSFSSRVNNHMAFTRRVIICRTPVPVSKHGRWHILWLDEWGS